MVLELDALKEQLTVLTTAMEKVKTEQNRSKLFQNLPVVVKQLFTKTVFTCSLLTSAYHILATPAFVSSIYQCAVSELRSA